MLTHSQYETPIGPFYFLCNGEIVHYCDFKGGAALKAYKEKFFKDMPMTEGPLHPKIKAAFDAYFTGGTHESRDALGPLTVDPKGTHYERRVWAALRDIPAGQVDTYGALVKKVGGHARAVGRANGANPISLILPCHRVIGADGSLTGYAGGLERKRWLLSHEGAGFLPL